MRRTVLCCLMLFAPGSAFYRPPVRLPTTTLQQQPLASTGVWMLEGSEEDLPQAATEDASEEAPPPNPPLSPMAKMRQRTEQGIVEDGDGPKINPENVLPPPEGLRNIAISLVFIAGFAVALGNAVATKQAAPPM